MTTKVAAERRYHHGDLRNALLQAALRLIAKQGAQALTLRAVARAAGVSPAAPYRHFADKEGLLAAVAEGGFHELAGEMRAAAQRAPDAAARLLAIGEAYVAFARAHPAHFHVMFGPAGARKDRHPALARVAAEAYGLLIEAVAAGQKSGALRAEEAPGAQALAAWATVHGLAALWVDGQLRAGTARDFAVQVRAVLSTLSVGLRSEPLERRAAPQSGSARRDATGPRSQARRSK